MELLFAGIAGGLFIAVLLIYIRNILFADIGMNLTTWLVSFIATLIQNITYYPTVDGAWHLLVVPTIITTGIAAVTIAGWKKSTFGSMTLFDKVLFVFILLCIVVWIVFDGVVANVILQIALFASFVPTMRDLRAKKYQDDAFPWGLAALAFIFQIIAVSLSVETLTSDWPRLVNPILVGLLGNALVSWHAFWGKR